MDLLGHEFWHGVLLDDDEDEIVRRPCRCAEPDCGYHPQPCACPRPCVSHETASCARCDTVTHLDRLAYRLPDFGSQYLCAACVAESWIDQGSDHQAWDLRPHLAQLAELGVWMPTEAP